MAGRGWRVGLAACGVGVLALLGWGVWDAGGAGDRTGGRPAAGEERPGAPGRGPAGSSGDRPAVSGENAELAASSASGESDLETDFAALLAEIDEFAAGDLPGGEASESAIEKLAQLFASNPAAMGAAAYRIRSSEVEFFTMLMLVDAMGVQKDTATAHRYLRGLVLDPAVDDGVWTAAVQALAYTDPVPPESMALIRKVATEAGLSEGFAQDALVELLVRWREERPEESLGLRDLLLAHARALMDRGEYERAHRAVAALKQSRDPSLIPFADSLRTHASGEMRAGGLAYLGYADPEGSRGILLEALREDPDGYVRAVVLQTLEPVPGEGPPTQRRYNDRIPPYVVDELVRLARVDPDRGFRGIIVDWFETCYGPVDWTDEDGNLVDLRPNPPPAVVTLLEEMLVRDPDPGVRARVKYAMMYVFHLLPQPKKGASGR